MNKFQEIIILDIEKFKTIVNESNGTGEICRKYNFHDNGQVRNIIKKYIKEYKLDTSHFGLKNHHLKYQFIEKTCPVCKNKFTTQINHPRETYTCSYKCSGLYFKRNHTDETKNKISKSVQNYLKSIGKPSITTSTYKCGKKITTPNFKINCIICGKEKLTRKKTQKCCSDKCAAQYRNQNPNYIQHLKEGIRRSILEGRHNGWSSRTIVSYPENFFKVVLKNNNIEYKHNKKVDKFFIDFAIEKENKKIALEIDGKQHNYPDRILKDQEKDKFLTEEGWLVYRIPWKSINTESGKLYMKEQIDAFLKVYDNYK